MELTEQQHKVLDAVLDCIIPPAPARGLPGASEVGFWPFIVRLVADEAGAIAEAIDWIDAEASNRLDASIADVDSSQAGACLAALREAHPGRLDRLGRLVMSCYYQHNDVLQGIGMEPRPPFPIGHTVHGGDLTLLEPVRQRGSIFRKV